MLRRIELIRWPVPAAEGALERLRDAAPGGLLQPTLPGSWNGGEWLRRWQGSATGLAAASAPSLIRAGVAADAAVYEEGEAGGDWAGGGIYRVLLLSLRPGIPAERQARFEREVLAMPRYIRAIRAWRLARVVQSEGARPWTHVWEQRYDALEGLAGEYMMHPYHWAHVDRWFDPESPDWIVDPHLCHSFCRFE
ncbi:Dabb family protein [Solimonas sp. K1W22B-7]|uniref:Dabb family protein n=1 Tax=Solimonas sp. K1W22B-7 TaxID=2303331 RepID=UPI000E33761F|nr:Dabb family protein [Solimonas sp. K1W22B-7]AXQ28328.1 Dabb family protein [Solimonas sp. K1W22B-7]